MYDTDDDWGLWAVGTLLVTLVIVVIVASFQWDFFRDKQADTVETVCNYSRTVNTKESKKLCGDVQEQTGTEYLCNTDGKCWVEQKQ